MLHKLDQEHLPAFMFHFQSRQNVFVIILFFYVSPRVCFNVIFWGDKAHLCCFQAWLLQAGREGGAEQKLKCTLGVVM